VAAAGRSVPPDAWNAAAARRVAAPTHCRPGGWRSASARCRAAIPVVVRVGAADGSCRPVVPGRGTAAEARRVGHSADRAQDQGPVARVRHPAGSSGRRPSVPPQTASGPALARRSRQEAGRAPEAWREQPVRASVPAARSRSLPGLSTRVLSAKRRRGRSQQISFGVRRRGHRPLSSINYRRSDRSHPATRVRRNRPANTDDGPWRTMTASE
jgi:hypothetical protein